MPALLFKLSYLVNNLVFRRSAGNEQPHVHEGILLLGLRLGRQRDEVCCRRLHGLFVLGRLGKSNIFGYIQPHFLAKIRLYRILDLTFYVKSSKIRSNLTSD